MGHATRRAPDQAIQPAARHGRMSAIGGLIALQPRAPLRPAAEALSSGLAGFGPHGSGLWEADDGGAALVWRQFQALPEDRLDRQPLRSADQVHSIVADARIDNLAELRAALALEHQPDLPDSAVILAAWRAWGETCVERLVGDFAFAIWDGRARSLFLARDAMGWRPLYWAATDETFGFASMPRGLFAMPGVSRDIDEFDVARQLMLQPPFGDDTAYRDIKRIAPGGCLTVTPAGRRSRVWWSAPQPDRARFRRYGDCVEALRETYVEAVRCRLRSAGGVAAQVSAGWDGASVAVIAARQLAGEGRRLSAFTASPREGFAGPTQQNRLADEFPLAAKVMAGEPNVDLVRVRSQLRSHLEVMQRQAAWQDLPMVGATGMVWSNRIAEAARAKGARVMLTGAFGNVTASYDGEMALPLLLRQGRWLALTRIVLGLRREGRSPAWSVWRAMAPSLPPPMQSFLARLFRRDGLTWDALRDTAMSPGYFAEHALADRATAHGWVLDGRRHASGRAARLTALGRVDNAYQRAAMNGAYGVDTRAPAKDRRVVELAFSIPEEHFVHEGRPSALFRDAMAGVLPAWQLARRVRGLQAADWYEGVVAARDELAAHAERLSRSPLAARILDIPRLRAAIADLPDPDTPPNQLAKGAWGELGALRRHGAPLLRAMDMGLFILRAEGRND